jgi:hypothetical protein
MIVSLLSQLKRTRETESGLLLLMLLVTAVSGKSMARSNNAFLGGLPAIMDCCKELIIICDSDGTKQIGRTVSNQLTSSCQKTVHVFALLDDAFTHAQNEFPHEVLELRRRRIRSGDWPTVGAKRALSREE